MTDQLSIDYQLLYRAETIQAQFEAFHAANPLVYIELVKLARRARSRGATRIGIGMLFEIVRWRRSLATTDWSAFKLNNNYRSRYARLIEAQEPDLRGMFETRELKAA